MVFGDVERANDAWNDRLQAVGEGAGVDTDRHALIGDETTAMLHADLWDAGEAEQVLGSLMTGYTGITRRGPMGEVLLGMVMHASAVGVLIERQRYEGGVGVREARLAVAAQEALDGMKEMHGPEVQRLRDLLAGALA